MSNLERMGLPSNILDKLKLNGYKNVGQIMSVSTLLLLSQDFDLSEIKSIVNTVSAKCAPKPYTALEHFYFHDQTLGEKKVLSTGSETLDLVLEGGVDYRSITELVGVSGTGKTQFCLSTCVEAILSSQSSSVVYIDTELKFDPTRLSKLFEYRLASRYNNHTSDDRTIDKLLDKVKVKRPKTCDELYHVIDGLEAEVLSEGVSLVVLDSIASLARKENLNEDDKEEFIIRQTGMLRRIAELCNCCVLVTNQITTTGSLYEEESSKSNMFNDVIYDVSKRMFRPALGASWYHCVDTRIILEKRSAVGHHSVSSSARNEFLSATTSHNMAAGVSVSADSSLSTSLYGFVRTLRVAKSPRRGTMCLWPAQTPAIYEIQEKGIYVTNANYIF